MIWYLEVVILIGRFCKYGFLVIPNFCKEYVHIGLSKCVYLFSFGFIDVLKICKMEALTKHNFGFCIAHFFGKATTENRLWGNGGNNNANVQIITTIRSTQNQKQLIH